MNFYEMRTHRHLRTVAAMDELESARFLPAKQAKLLLGLTTSGSSSDGGKAKKGLKQKQVSVIDGGCHHVLVCGGQTGLLRLFHVLYHAAPKAGKGSNAGHTFSCIPLLALAPSGPSIVHRASFALGLPGASDKWGEEVDGGVGGHEGGGKGTPTTTTSRADTGACTSIENLLLGPDHLTVVTADQSFITYSVVAGAASRGLALRLSRQLVGTHDDILDLSLLQPSPPAGTDTGGTDTGGTGTKGLCAVAATNSPHIHAIDLPYPPSDAASEAGCRLMYGHTDVVLAVDAAPDG